MKIDFANDSDRETSFFSPCIDYGGEDVERVAIIGQGKIDGNRNKREPQTHPPSKDANM